MIKIKKLIALLSILILWSGNVNAASDGTLGITSEGDVGVTVDVNPQVQLTGMANFDQVVYTGQTGDHADFRKQEDVCIYSNDPTNNQFTITATSGNTDSAGTFKLKSGSNYVSYQLAIGPLNSNVGDASPTTEIIESAAAATITDATSIAHNTSTNCAGGNSGTLSIKVSDTEIANSAPGDYTDTITVTVGGVI